MPDTSHRTLVTLVGVLLAGATAAASAQGVSAPRGCAPGGAERAWMQQALDEWETVSRDFLRVSPAPLAPMVLFDTACAWYLAPDTAGSPELHRRTADAGVRLAFAGGTVAVRALRHRGMVPIPGGDSVPAVPTAFAAPYLDDRASFFVMAMPSLWKQEPRHAAEPDLDAFFQSVFAHEMTHTRQVTAVSRRVEALRARYVFPEEFDDDIVQTRFDSVPGFRAAYEAERDLLYRAAVEPDPARRREIARSALAAARERRARYFAGENAVYAELEDLFLNMEGVANWSALMLARRNAGPGATDAEVLARIRRNGRYWSQDEGLALLLVIDRLVPGWQARMFGSEPASVWNLLEEGTR